MEKVRVGLLVHWGALFDIDAAAIRVAVGRLARQALIAPVERGVYTIGPAGRLMADTARQWMQAESRIRAWTGDWIVVHTGDLGRTDKTALRGRERALRLGGFAALSTGLWCRPDNLARSLTGTRDELVNLGLEPAAIVVRATEVLGIEAASLHALWPRDELEASYRAHIKAMRSSVEAMPARTPADAARETFLLGEAVIRLINVDPLLPDELVDAAARRELIEAMTAYNATGEAAWGAFSATVG